MSQIRVYKLNDKQPENGELCLVCPVGLHWREAVYYENGIGKRGAGFYDTVTGKDKVYLGNREIVWMLRPDECGNAYSFTDNRICFVRRKSDGKFLRGAKLWKWTKNWRRAAALPVDHVRQLFNDGFMVEYGVRLEDVELLTCAEQLA